jgi:hypothetical protein
MTIETLTGVVEHWAGSHGFIRITGQRDSIFLHKSRLIACGINPTEMTVGTKIKFDVVPSKKRPGGWEAGGMIRIEAGTVAPPYWWEKVCRDL